MSSDSFHRKKIIQIFPQGYTIVLKVRHLRICFPAPLVCQCQFGTAMFTIIFNDITNTAILMTTDDIK